MQMKTAEEFLRASLSHPQLNSIIIPIAFAFLPSELIFRGG